MRKEIAKNIQAWQTGDWKCKCGKLNTAEKKVCSDCGESRSYANQPTSRTDNINEEQKEKEG